MKLLYITESVPNRDPMLGDGSSMIPFELLRNLPGNVAVTLLTFAGPVDVPAEIRNRCDAVHVLATRKRIWATLLSGFGLNGLGKHERSTAAALASASELSAQHDATLIHGPHALFLAHSVSGPLVLQTVDPWSIRAAMDTAIARTLRPAYRAREILALLAERRLPSRARLLAVGAQDALAWSERLGRSVGHIPNGAEQSFRTGTTRDVPVVCFVGSLNYGPNIDSATVLIGKIAPLVWQQVPEARFVIAGRRPVPSVLALAGPRVEVLANVPSVLDVFHSADVAAFPDEHGVGIRNSVREALAAGLPVVATPVAAREQDPHSLLAVEGDTQGFVERLVGHLTERGGHGQEPGHGPLRTWKTVAHDYLDELERAIQAADPGLPLGSPQA
ncbi:glycosyltransferase [Arthrobacter sp. CJ23]|uniref:glycosyltransferase n=1 Tax=Arthrobacter sp. CJ23 TaxID=2972479 RepID=UPI00215BC45B|nr:glycosyltransferase family 4 protein [Arthrobacter sp. CJ23]UVJ39569.1 glycosyltransferase family 4 protein [Arthrobacter sp. CJ23]